MLNFFCKHSRHPELKGYGLDINPKAIAKAKELFPNQHTFLLNQQGIAIPYEDKFFDVVILIATMKHIRFEDRKPLYDELNRVPRFVMV
jgi:ubiquinone/menaquinone biosynthesis C-methylase UbiE